MAKKKAKEQYLFEVPVSRKEAAVISKLSEKHRVILRKRLIEHLRTLLTAVQTYVKLME